VTRSRQFVAVVGPRLTTDRALLDAAASIGAGLARAGLAVVTGGLDGVMAAASRGAREAGGLVLGILPGPDADAANEWVDVAVPTAMGEGRNVLVVRTAAVVVAVGGSWGTLAEIALALRLGRPVVSLHGWSVDGPDAPDAPVTVGSPDEAVRAAVSLLSSTPS
jgi:uncharacterized protein (TIGR00725 family)